MKIAQLRAALLLLQLRLQLVHWGCKGQQMTPPERLLSAVRRARGSPAAERT